MKRILIILFLSLLSSFSLAKGLQPEDVIKDAEFSKNDSNVVIFKTAQDMFEEYSDYYVENNTLQITSENPLKLRLSVLVEKEDNLTVINSLQQRAVIYGVYKTFTHTKADNIDLTITALDSVTGKQLLKPQIHISVSRKRALETLQNFTKVTSFNLLATQIAQSDFEVVGYSSSALYKELLNNDEIRPQVIKYLMRK